LLSFWFYVVCLFFLCFFLFVFLPSSPRSFWHSPSVSDGLWTKETYPGPVWKLVLPMLTRGMASSPRDAEEAWPLFVRSCAYDVDPRRVLPLARHLLRGLSTAMCDGGSSLDQTRALRAIAPLLSEMSWRGRYFARELAQILSGRLASEFKAVRSAMASVMSDIFRLLSNAPRAEGRDAGGRNAEPHAVLPRDDDFGVVVAEDDDDYWGLVRGGAPPTISGGSGSKGSAAASPAPAASSAAPLCPMQLLDGELMRALAEARRRKVEYDRSGTRDRRGSTVGLSDVYTPAPGTPGTPGLAANTSGVDGGDGTADGGSVASPRIGGGIAGSLMAGGGGGKVGAAKSSKINKIIINSSIGSANDDDGDDDDDMAAADAARAVASMDRSGTGSPMLRDNDLDGDDDAESGGSDDDSGEANGGSPGAAAAPMSASIPAHSTPQRCWERICDTFLSVLVHSIHADGLHTLAPYLPKVLWNLFGFFVFCFFTFRFFFFTPPRFSLFYFFFFFFSPLPSRSGSHSS
jgi:hypothetical protein